jgi:hypothetical protein
MVQTDAEVLSTLEQLAFESLGDGSDGGRSTVYSRATGV